MTEIDFEPLTGLLGIAGSSYILQIGLINGKWAVRLLRGKKILDVLICKDKDIESGLPNQNVIINWVLRSVAIPNISSFHIKRTVQILLKQARANKDKLKVRVTIKEVREIELKKVSTSKLVRNENSSGKKDYICESCGFHIKCCPNCGTEMG